MIIRPATPEDAERLIEIYQYYINQTTITFEEIVPSGEDFKKRMESIAYRYPYIVAVANDEITGFAYATHFRKRSAYRWIVEVAIYIDREHQEKGAGRKLLNTLLDILKLLGYYDAYAVITLPNEKSVRFFESYGFVNTTVFKQAGYKHNTWCDAGVWVKKIQERKDNPEEPGIFSELDYTYNNNN